MILLDTSFIVAYYSSRDKYHNRAMELMRDIVEGSYGAIMITDYVFDETITTVASFNGVDAATRVGIELLDTIEMIGIKSDNFTEAWKLFKAQRNTRLSFTDCTNVAVMRSSEIAKMATFDSDFKAFKDLMVVN
jgi:hypothetical protein